MNEEEKLKIEMSELMTRLKLCTIKTERAIGMTKDVLNILEDVKQEHRDIDGLIMDWLGEDENE